MLPWIRALDPSDVTSCDSIIAGLPGWFGNQTGIRDCAAAVRSQAGLIADLDTEVVGFLTWEPTQTATAEITWMAVRVDLRREGVGRALLEQLVSDLLQRGVSTLHVKTLSSRDPDPGYAQTRAFYLANGFEANTELDIWGPENPAVLLARKLPQA